MPDVLIHADLPHDRCSSVIGVARSLIDQVRAAGIDVAERRVVERRGKVYRTKVSWFHGYPHQLAHVPMQLGAVRIAGLQVDASPAPEAWRPLLRHLHAVYVPSTWCQRVLEPLLPVGCEVFVVPHGIDRPPPPPGPLDRGDPPCAVCFSLPGGDQPSWQAAHHLRKGVDIAVEATRLAGWELVLRAGSAARQWTEGADHVVVLDRYMVPGEMSDLMRRAHAVLVPSRAEAYGMIASEALAHGAVVVATTGTGMDDYLPRDNRVVRVRPAELGGDTLSTFGLDVGAVNRVDARAVARGLRRALVDHDARRAASEAGANAWYRGHSWRAAAAPLVEWIRARVS